MKVAVIGSRGMKVDRLELFLPEETQLIVSGGALGVDRSAERFAKAAGIPLKVFLPDYEKWGRRAPIVRNLDIIAAADLVLAFWDGRSKGTEFVIEQCRKQGKPLKIFLADPAAEGGFSPYCEPQQLSF